MRLLKAKRTFRKEFKRQIKLAIVAAVGFTIAFAWRDAIFSTFQNFTTRILEIDPNHYLTNTYTALFLTAAGVILILITSKLLKD